MIIQYKFMKMPPTAPIITYCINGNTFYRIPLAQIPLVRTPFGNSNRLPTINKNSINKNNINKSIPSKIITIDMVRKSCAIDCKWP